MPRMVIVLIATVGCMEPVHCTQSGEKCCPDKSCSTPGVGTQFGACAACGMPHQPCCSGGICDDPTTACAGYPMFLPGSCEACGDREQICCTGAGLAPCKSGFACRRNELGVSECFASIDAMGDALPM